MDAKPYQCHTVLGHKSDVFRGDQQSAQLLRLMIASNKLLVLHRMTELAIASDESLNYDIVEFREGYVGVPFLIICGVLSEAMDALRSLGKGWFESVEQHYPKSDDLELPVGECRQLIALSQKDSKEMAILKSARNMTAYHWNQSELIRFLDTVPDEDIVLSRVVQYQGIDLVHYDIAGNAMAYAAFGNDESSQKDSLKRIEVILVTFLRVTIHCLPAYLRINGCYRKNQGPKKA